MQRETKVMKRTTIMLPRKLKAQADHLAKSQGISLGELIRDALSRSLDTRKRRERDPLFADTAAVADDWPADVAANHDKYLLKILEEQHLHGRRRSKRKAS